jgi:hypothetical protein
MTGILACAATPCTGATVMPMQIDPTSPRRCRMAAVAAAAGPLALVSAAALAQVAAPMDSAPVQRCRTIAEPAARLACYDAIALPGLGSRAGWGAPVGAAPPAAAPRSAPAAGADSFGMERREATTAPDRLESRLAGAFEGWEPGTRFTLENGQVWQIVDGSRAYYGRQAQPRVVVSRGLLGSFYLQIEGVNQSPRVRRVQ